ncbi:BglG family transcription antiterminator [Photobacterium leiognathi]|uniref:BglG family transcription antiterminator n=1 Tax=Photobacterium leiognathi TaxID=553611 RepID=UPI0029820B75|nr:PRD domain-containing protein [Photobacterium leiognathi]
MIQFPYPRLNLIFDALLTQTLPQQELAQRFDVSTRTIRTDISALNDTLAHYGAQLLLRRGEGYYIDIYDQQRYSNITQQTQQMKQSPRSVKDRVTHLMLRLLNQQDGCKLDDLANQWFVSRTCLQADMTEVRELFQSYHLEIDSKPHYGLFVFGKESSIRACIAHILFQFKASDPTFINLCELFYPECDFAQLEQPLLMAMQQHSINLTDEGLHQLTVYCGVAISRLKRGLACDQTPCANVPNNALAAAEEIATLMASETQTIIDPCEINHLAIQIAARRVTGIKHWHVDDRNDNDADAFIDHLLHFINDHFNYNLLNDPQLKHDLLAHVHPMLLRVEHQITIPNPLADHIKRYYPLAYDMTVGAVSSWDARQIPDGEISFLVMHIGVGIERNYVQKNEKQPTVLLVCDSGTSVIRMLESQLLKAIPQLVIHKMHSIREYDALHEVTEDFVVATEKLAVKNKPTMEFSPIASTFQLEQLNKLVHENRNHINALGKFFQPSFFSRIETPMTQHQLFAQLSAELEAKGIVPSHFHPSVIERENITSTMLGEGIAIPHSLGLCAKQSAVYTVLAPQGIEWGEGKRAYVIFLFAINKDDYEEAMGLYDLFVTLMKSKAVEHLLACYSFEHFTHITNECWNSCKKDW